MKPRLIRRAQTLNPFGVGAIIDIEGESFIAADIVRWKAQGEVIREERLEKVLGVEQFKTAPVYLEKNIYQDKDTGSHEGIPYFRFPQWLFCSRCRRMLHWSMTREQGEAPECTFCMRKPKPRLVPMRFVIACPLGHVADVPWDLWAHSKSTIKCEHRDLLEFKTRSGGSGLEFVSVRCHECESERSLAGIASPHSMREIHFKCPGRQPWQNKNEEQKCDAVPIVLQRGATNLTFAITTSSIDIPPYSNFSYYSNDNLTVTNTPEFKVLQTAQGGPLEAILIQKIANEKGISVEKVKNIVNAEIRKKDAESILTPFDPVKENELLNEEFKAFLSPDEQADLKDYFIKRRVSLEDFVNKHTNKRYQTALSSLTKKMDAIVQIIRLREVRVLRGFSRLAPASGETEDGEGPGTFALYNTNKKIAPQMVYADLGGLHTHKWLPAIEVFGEGIFISLSEMDLQDWENMPSVKSRANILGKRFKDIKSSFLPPPTPRLLLLHTLAHILIRQLSFECGYSLASLRERIYSAEIDSGHPMAGVLIYTAAGDSEGTLGGLVREGEPDRILTTIIKSLQSAEWCSSDPLCRESNGQGMEAMNLAACHACTLIPETSCVLSNRMLDRSMLIGNTDDPQNGFFSSVLTSLLHNITEE